MTKRNSIQVLKAGMHSSVQDLGCTGYRHLGITTGGALDRHALILANRLLGNSDASAGIELTSGIVELKFNCDTWFVLTGANYRISIGQRDIWCNWRNKIRAGETLTLRGPKSGMRAYLALEGGIVDGIEGEIRDGSPETNNKLRLKSDSLLGDRFSGVLGAVLKDGDRLALGQAGAISKPIGAVQRGYSNEIRALPGPEMPLFSEESKKAFWNSSWQLTNESNRMGARLSGITLSLAQQQDMESHAVMPGAVQVPPAGQPIVLLADSQTTGGYPKIATVIEADLWKLAQTRPGEEVRFVHVSPNQADDANYEWEEYFYRLQRAIEANG
ncbi:UreA amidolyase related protein [Shewanella sediminis HAW-EB3]|uniref:UreA amidolyase related protein n=1 Tax=Shewanella sediminis (strain HAW-EB3) TaxID=425104 RepID=A8FP51_SHESH|nr:biotin-dependent carboxyltransferase family protein [Shewanella sediminis]ABV34624.1 UreA amidolyase related protein [Shewanella sediminis HAW-EB3]